MRLFPAIASSLLAAALLATVTHTGHAAWPHHPAVNLAVCDVAGSQFVPVAVGDGAGGMIVAWYDYRGAAGDIYAQRVDAAGRLLWDPAGVPLCTATGLQYFPKLVEDGAGGAIAVWTDQRGASMDLYAQRVSAAGVTSWAPDGVPVVTAVQNQYNVSAVSDGAGGILVAWQDARNGQSDVYAQRLDGAGVPQWTTDGVGLCVTAGSQQEVKLASDGAGGAIAVWQDDRNGDADIYAQRLGHDGSAAWVTNGIPACNLTGAQTLPAIASDGAGGALVAWADARGATVDAYAQRLDALGGALWTGNGVVVANGTGAQNGLTVACDGAGGAIVTWQDTRSDASADLYAQRIGSGGAPVWAANGIAIAAAGGTQGPGFVSLDAAGAATIAWSDGRNGFADVFAQRVSAAGTPQWSANGIAVCTAARDQTLSSLLGDAGGTVVAVWYDYRGGTLPDVFAQRFEKYGRLGDPAPALAGVKDLLNDQGGQVKLSWDASWPDADPDFGVADYRVWRSVPAAFSPVARAARTVSADADEAARPGGLLADPFGAQAYYWEYVALVGAAQLPGYSLVAATTCDSVAGSNPRTVFMLEARAGAETGAARWFSAPDSGYSVDNLAPAAPAPFTGQYAGGSVALAWDANAEADLAGYRLHRGHELSFVPGPSNLVAALAEPGYTGSAGAPFVYKLVAVDVHGNESPAATLVPGGTLDAGGPAAPRAYLALASANPARGPASLRFGLARAGHVRLDVHDAAGRCVRTLATGSREAGEYALEWDGRDARGRPVPAGLYFARLEAPGLRATRRVVRM